MPDIHSTYETLHQQNLARLNRLIKKNYKKAINTVTLNVKRIRIKGKLFELDQYPQLRKVIDEELLKMRKQVYTGIVNSIETSWNLSNEKNNIIADKRIRGKNIPQKKPALIYDPNRGALTQYLERKKNGLGLSDRVWNSVKPFRNELEQAIGLAIGEGKSADNLAKEIQKYLNEPNKLFKRVKGEDGKLSLSLAARGYKPGRGVYRSSYKNALRVARTETNMAYRTADHERWQKMPFVVGIEVRLSNSHPRYDICDPLAGRYPKDFKFTGWHPQCLCFATPIMMEDDAYDKLEDQILAGGPVRVPKKLLVSKPPSTFTKYLEQNEKRIKAWKNKPYWMQDNKQYVK
jgi:hypothetical protein